MLIFFWCPEMMLWNSMRKRRKFVDAIKKIFTKGGIRMDSELLVYITRSPADVDMKYQYQK